MMRFGSGAGLVCGALLALAPLASSLGGNAPYDEHADAMQDLRAAEQRADAADRLVLVIFGANWCPDCIVLHRNLDDPGATHDYAVQHFEIVSVDVGQKDKNLALAAQLGVSLDKGIPVAAILGKDGKVLATTNRGELEAARHYSTQQIQQFMQAFVDKHVVIFPNQPLGR